MRFRDANIYNGLRLALYELGMIELAEGNARTAFTHFHEALELLLNSDPTNSMVVKLIIGMGSVAVANGMPALGIEFLSAVDRWSIVSATQWTPDEQATLDAIKSVGQGKLSADDYARAWTQGSLYSIEVASRIAFEMKMPERITAIPEDIKPAGAVDAYRLSAQERRILCMIVRGEKNRQIAEQLFISERTVAVHVQNILRKMDADNRTHASSLAFHAGLCPSG